jgi:Thioester domain
MYVEDRSEPTGKNLRTMNKHRGLLGALLALLTLPASAGAGQITDLQLYDGTSNSPIVTIDYSNANGTGNNSVEVYADPQVSGGTKAPLYYCIDLWHDNDLGATYTITPASTMSYAESSTFCDVDNRLAWLMQQAQNTPDERAAVQLAMWYTIDNVQTRGFSGFSFTGGDAALRKDYNELISFAGYDPSVHYEAQFWAATHDSKNTLYQNLISAAAVPEPDGRALLGIGALAVLGFRVRRGRP